MKLVITKSAYRAILATAKWVDEQNTSGAGDRWLEKIFEELNKHAQAGAQHAKCHQQLLAAYDYRCFPYDKWIVAFKIENRQYVIHRFIWAGYLV